MNGTNSTEGEEGDDATLQLSEWEVKKGDDDKDSYNISAEIPYPAENANCVMPP